MSVAVFTVGVVAVPTFQPYPATEQSWQKVTGHFDGGDNRM